MNETEGFWGPVTASIDWCEENYERTPYLAEFWNSISSLSFCLMTIAEVYFLLVNPFHPRDPKKNDDEERGGVGPPKGFEARFIALTIATCVVGLGSLLFHGTLWYSMQMADELPMTWSVLVSVFICLENRLKRPLPKLGVALWAYAIISTMWQIYLTRTFPILHEIQFGLLLGFCFLSTLIYVRERKSWEISFLFSFHTVLTAIAFLGCWVPDQVFCSYWRSLGRHNPQLHAFWHLFMCLSVHFSSLIIQYERAEILKQVCKQIPSPPPSFTNMNVLLQNPKWRKIGFLPIAVSISQ